MITQSQYFDIEEYLQHECRVIEPDLLEELIDHFMNGIETVKLSEEDFIVAFEVVKADFGGEAEVRKIQRRYQVNALKTHAKGVFLELRSYFQKPFAWVTLICFTLVTTFIFYYKLQLVGWDRIHVWLGMISGSLFGGVFITMVFYFQNKVEFGSHGFQTRNWFTFLATQIITLIICIAGILAGLVVVPIYAQSMTAFFAMLGGLIIVAIFRYSHRELYPEYT